MQALEKLREVSGGKREWKRELKEIAIKEVVHS